MDSRSAPCLDSPRRAAAMELLLLAPAAALVVAGAIGWGGYWRLTQRVEQIAEAAAEAAARAPVQAREAVARAKAVAELGVGKVDVSLVMAGGQETLQLDYDASKSPIFMIGDLMPMPSPSIVRVASVEAR